MSASICCSEEPDTAQLEQVPSMKWKHCPLLFFIFHTQVSNKSSIWHPQNATYQLKLDIDVRRGDSAWHNHLLGISKDSDHQWHFVVGLHKGLVVVCRGWGIRSALVFSSGQESIVFIRPLEIIAFSCHFIQGEMKVRRRKRTQQGVQSGLRTRVS